jgi:hypothetical protein
MTYSVSQAKTAIKRSLWEIVNPPPENFDPLWEHFADRCAYCRTVLERGGRYVRRDHLDVSENQIKMTIGHFILACDKCNIDRRKEKSWLDHLVKVATGNHTKLLYRQTRIETWIRMHACENPLLEPYIVASVTASIDEVFECLNQAVDRVRKRKFQGEEFKESGGGRLSEAEAKRIDLMIAMADDETFAKERIVAFTWNIFQTDLVKKAAHVEDLKFEEFIKKVTYASAVKLLKKAQRD